MNPRGLGIIAWTYAKLGVRNPEFMSAISSASKKLINEFEPLSLSLLAGAFGRLQIEDKELMYAIAKAVTVRPEKFGARDWRMIIEACHQTGVDTDDLFAMLEAHLNSGKNWEMLDKMGLR